MELDLRREAEPVGEEVSVEVVAVEKAEWGDPDPVQVPEGTVFAQVAGKRYPIKLVHPAST
jgi:hypothetical protein